MDGDGDMLLAMSDMHIIKQLNAKLVDESRDLLCGADLVVCDGNLSAQTIERLAQVCDRPLYLDPVSTAWARELKPFIGCFDTVKPNRMELEVLSGDDALTLPMISVGACGVISVVSNAMPREMSELVRLALTRARFCLLLAQESSLSTMADELFLLGLFSLLDAMLDVPMAAVVGRLPLQQAMKSALLDLTGPLAPFLRAIVAIEQGDAAACTIALNELEINSGRERQLYLDAIAFTESVMQF